METLATSLQRERLLLELLVFKITQLRHLLDTGNPRFLGWASEEVERSVEAVRAAELERALLVQAAAGDLPADAVPDGLDEATLLTALAESAGEPWVTVVAEHREALVALAGEVAAGLAAARRSVSAGASAVADLLERVESPVAEPALVTYGPGRTSSWTAPAHRFHTTL